MPSKDQLLSKLQVLINEMMATEQLVVPTLRWDPVSNDEKEVRAVARIGLLISAYEPQYYWFESLFLKHVIPLLVTDLTQIYRVSDHLNLIS